MKISNFKFQIHKLLAPLLVILIAALLRLLPYPPNFTPIAAIALFGGAYLPKRFAIALPLAAMFISDLFLGFHTTMPFVYGSFLLTGFLGMWLRRRKTVGNVLFAALFSSVFFFLITNFGVWAMGSMYEMTLSGLMQSYVMGLPFFRNTLVGDLFYTGLFFGGYEVFQKTQNILRTRVSDHQNVR